MPTKLPEAIRHMAIRALVEEERELQEALERVQTALYQERLLWARANCPFQAGQRVQETGRASGAVYEITEIAPALDKDGGWVLRGRKAGPGDGLHPGTIDLPPNVQLIPREENQCPKP